LPAFQRSRAGFFPGGQLSNFLIFSARRCGMPPEAKARLARSSPAGRTGSSAVVLRPAIGAGQSHAARDWRGGGNAALSLSAGSEFHMAKGKNHLNSENPAMLRNGVLLQ